MSQIFQVLQQDTFVPLKGSSDIVEAYQIDMVG
jgi:hypothetical protein